MRVFYFLLILTTGLAFLWLSLPDIPGLITFS